MSDATTKPTVWDAIICDQGYPPGKGDKLINRNRVLGPLLGATRVFSRHLPGNRVLVTAERADHTVMFHPSPDDYDFEDRGDGVMLGTIKAPDAEPEDAGKVAADLMAKRKAELEKRVADLEAADKPTAAQTAELNRLKAFLARLYPGVVAGA